MKSNLVAWTSIGGLTAIVVVVMSIGGQRPEVVLVASLGLVVGVVMWMVHNAVDNADASMAFGSARPVAPDGRLDRRVDRLRSGLAYGRADAASFDHLRLRLVDVIADQLRAAHQIDLDDDHDASCAVIGPQLARLVSDCESAGDLADPATLDRILTLIERI